jgi:acylphosphatase
LRSVDARVTGRVQGVFFRLSTQEKAIELGIRGTVRNEADGSVFIEAVGGPREMEQFLAWIHEGPSGARVDSVTVTERESRAFSGFEILA